MQDKVISIDIEDDVDLATRGIKTKSPGEPAIEYTMAALTPREPSGTVFTNRQARAPKSLERTALLGAMTAMMGVFDSPTVRARTGPISTYMPYRHVPPVSLTAEQRDGNMSKAQAKRERRAAKATRDDVTRTQGQVRPFTRLITPPMPIEIRY